MAFFNELTGQFRDALDDYEKALYDSENLYVKEHPSVIELQLLCASRYRLFGDYIKEMELYEKVLPAQIKILGGDHPDTERTRTLMERCQRELV